MKVVVVILGLAPFAGLVVYSEYDRRVLAPRRRRAHAASNNPGKLETW